MPTKIVRVAIDVPAATLFDYRADTAHDDDIGCRVLVPLGRRTIIGVIVEVAANSRIAAERIRPIIEIYRDGTRLTAEDLRLLRFASDYYQHPLGAVVMTALPALLRRRRPANTAERANRYTLTSVGASVQLAGLPARAKVLRQVLERFHSERVVDSATLRALAPTALSCVRALRKKGWIAAAESEVVVSTPDRTVDAPVLTPAQQHAVRAVCGAMGQFSAFLLLGVTGSGKTEVYLHAIDATLRAGRQALLLVPEIALTPQLEAMIRARFPSARLTSLHSGLNETERSHSWQLAQSGHAQIVVGTRLAVLAPLPALGLIVVDEEHDASLKQTEGLCYSARDVAVVRAQQRGVPVVLGSATPSAESYYNAQRGRYRLIELPQRIKGTMPVIRCIDTRGARLDNGLSPSLCGAIATRLANNEQTLVFINRRGYAPVLMCHACGWLSGCHRCSAQLVLHLNDRRLRCHHCGHEESVPAMCPECGNVDLSPVGQGTQRIERALHERFPAARIVRIDRDTTRRKNSWRDMREHIHAGEFDILVGTQILAKGHDFPRLGLVGVLNADSTLYSSDFRAAERLFALLTQVAGRAGRDRVRGEVLVQTEFPDHPLFAALRIHDVHAFARQLLVERKQTGFPPYTHQALLRAEAPRLETALDYLERAAAIARELTEDVTIYDPVPAPLVRLAGRERAHVLVQSPSRKELHTFLRTWRDRLSANGASAARWALDVDPLEF